jgi:hypothetical protein
VPGTTSRESTLTAERQPKAVRYYYDGILVSVMLFEVRYFHDAHHSDEHKMIIDISRFLDRSASITASELKREWPA